MGSEESEQVCAGIPGAREPNAITCWGGNFIHLGFRDYVLDCNHLLKFHFLNLICKNVFFVLRPGWREEKPPVCVTKTPIVCSSLQMEPNAGITSVGMEIGRGNNGHKEHRISIFLHYLQANEVLISRMLSLDAINVDIYSLWGNIRKLGPCSGQ